MVTFDGSVHRDAGKALQACGESRVWLLKRNCALSPRQILTFYLSLMVLSVLIAGGFAWFGAWMVLPFAGLEMLALGVALLLYARHATDHERVVLEQGLLKIEVVDAGRSTVTTLHPCWTRVALEDATQARFVLRPPLVVVREREHRLVIGRHVGEDRRRLFARELKSALKYAVAPRLSESAARH